MNNKIEYSKATKDDERALVELDLLFNEDDETKTPQNIGESIKTALGKDLIWVAKDGNKVVGYVFCELFEEDHNNFPNSVFVSDFFVLKEYRKKGIGRELLTLALAGDFPKKYAYFSITHDPNETHLTNYYKSFGFEERGATKAGNIKLTRPRF